MEVTVVKEQGFTLIELIVTIAIAAILATLAAPSFSNQLASSQINSCAQSFYQELTKAKELSAIDFKIKTVTFGLDKCSDVNVSGDLTISFQKRIAGKPDVSIVSTVPAFTPYTSDKSIVFSKSNTSKTKTVTVKTGKYGKIEIS